MNTMDLTQRLALDIAELTLAVRRAEYERDVLKIELSAAHARIADLEEKNGTVETD